MKACSKYRDQDENGNWVKKELSVTIDDRETEFIIEDEKGNKIKLGGTGLNTLYNFIKYHTNEEIANQIEKEMREEGNYNNINPMDGTDITDVFLRRI